MAQYAVLAGLADEYSEGITWVGGLAPNLERGLRAESLGHGEVAACLIGALESYMTIGSEGWAPVETLMATAPSVSEFSDDHWAHVVILSELVSSPIVSAVLADVLWHFRSGVKPHENAEKATASYAAVLSDEEHHVRLRLYAAQRATDLTVGTRGSRDALFARVRAFAETVEDPGEESVVARLCQLLAQLDREKAFDVIESLETTLSGPDELRLTADAKHACRPSNSPANYDLAIGRLLGVADHAGSSQAWMFLRRASQLAVEKGHPAAAEIRLRLQNHDQFADVEPTRSSFPFEALDPLRVDMVNGIVGADNLGSALRRFTHASTGLHGSSDATQGGPRGLSDLITSLQIGPLGSVTSSAVGRSNDSTFMLMTSAVFAPALSQILFDYRPTRHELSLLLENSGVVTSDAAQVLVEGILLFGEQRYESSAATLSGRIEEVVRNLVKGEIVVTKDPIGEERGGVKSLGEILSLCRTSDSTAISAAQLEMLDFVLVNDTGLNLRNVVAHALQPDPISAGAAVAVIICLLQLVIRIDSEDP